MMNKNLLPVLIVLLCVSCAANVPHSINENMKGIFAESPKDKATVVFVRDSDFHLNKYPFAIYDDEIIIGVVKGKNYFTYTTTPGKHVFGAFVQPPDTGDNYWFIDADLSPGRIYYIYVRPYSAPFVGLKTDLEPLRYKGDNWDDLPKWLSTCSLTVINEETVAWDKTNSAHIKEVRLRSKSEWLNDKDRAEKALKPEDGLTTPIAPQ